MRRGDTRGFMSAIIITTGFDPNEKVSDPPCEGPTPRHPWHLERGAQLAGRRDDVRPALRPIHPVFPVVPPPRRTSDPIFHPFFSIAARDQSADREARRHLRRSGLHRGESVRLLRHEEHQLAQVRPRGEAVQARGHLRMAPRQRRGWRAPAGGGSRPRTQGFPRAVRMCHGIHAR